MQVPRRAQLILLQPPAASHRAQHSTRWVPGAVPRTTPLIRLSPKPGAPAWPGATRAALPCSQQLSEQEAASITPHRATKGARSGTPAPLCMRCSCCASSSPSLGGLQVALSLSHSSPPSPLHAHQAFPSATYGTWPPGAQTGAPWPLHAPTWWVQLTLGCPSAPPRAPRLLPATALWCINSSQLHFTQLLPCLGCDFKLKGKSVLTSKCWMPEEKSPFPSSPLLL